jgi:Protein of unknown function (DUF3040)
MLSERDRRALDEIEQQITRADPRFAASMQRATPTRTDRWTRHGYDVTIMLGAVTAALCFVLLLICAGVVAVMLVAATFLLRPKHLTPRTDRWRARLRRTDR